MVKLLGVPADFPRAGGAAMRLLSRLLKKAVAAG